MYRSCPKGSSSSHNSKGNDFPPNVNPQTHKTKSKAKDPLHYTSLITNLVEEANRNYRKDLEETIDRFRAAFAMIMKEMQGLNVQ